MTLCNRNMDLLWKFIVLCGNNNSHVLCRVDSFWGKCFSAIGFEQDIKGLTRTIRSKSTGLAVKQPFCSCDVEMESWTFWESIWFCPIIELGYFLPKLFNLMCLDGFRKIQTWTMSIANPNSSRDSWNDCLFKRQGKLFFAVEAKIFFFKCNPPRRAIDFSFSMHCVFSWPTSTFFFFYLGQAPFPHWCQSKN